MENQLTPEEQTAETIQVTYILTDNPHKNTLMSQIIERNIFRLNENQKKDVLLFAHNQEFRPTFHLSYFWQFIEKVSDPIENLAKVGGIVVPIMSQHMERDAAVLASGMCAVSSLVFGKIHGYAKDQVTAYQNITLTLNELGKIFASPTIAQEHPNLEFNNTETMP
jgi:hypothetical protein